MRVNPPEKKCFWLTHLSIGSLHHPTAEYYFQTCNWPRAVCIRLSRNLRSKQFKKDAKVICFSICFRSEKDTPFIRTRHMTEISVNLRKWNVSRTSVWSDRLEKVISFLMKHGWRSFESDTLPLPCTLIFLSWSPPVEIILFLSCPHTPPLRVCRQMHDLAKGSHWGHSSKLTPGWKWATLEGTISLWTTRCRRAAVCCSKPLSRITATHQVKRLIATVNI